MHSYILLDENRYFQYCGGKHWRCLTGQAENPSAEALWQERSLMPMRLFFPTCTSGALLVRQFHYPFSFSGLSAVHIGQKN